MFPCSRRVPLIQWFCSSLEILPALRSGKGITGYGVMLGLKFWCNFSDLKWESVRWLRGSVSREEGDLWGKLPGFDSFRVFYEMCYLKQVSFSACFLICTTEAIMIVIYLRVKWAHSGRMLRLVPGTSCSKGLILCFDVWEMLLLPVCSPFGVKVELSTLYMSRSLKRWHSKATISLIVRHNTWPVVHSFQSWV